jgi:hypothetical protein
MYLKRVEITCGLHIIRYICLIAFFYSLYISNEIDIQDIIILTETDI